MELRDKERKKYNYYSHVYIYIYSSKHLKLEAIMWQQTLL